MQPSTPPQLPITSVSSPGVIEQRSHSLMRWLQYSSFSPAWVPSWGDHVWSGYVALFIVIAVVTTLGLFLRHLVSNFHTFGLLELAAITFISVNWGLGPGICATMLATICLNILLFPPSFALSYDLPALLSTFLLLSLGVIMSIGAHKVQLARRRSSTLAASLAARLLQEREQALEQQAASHAREMALQEINHQMDTFLSMAAHELRTPLTIVKISVQLAKRTLTRLVLNKTDVQQPSLYDLKAYHESQTLLERAEHKIKLQERIINDLLDTTRLQTDRLVLQWTPTDLLSLVQQTVEDQRTLNPQRRIIFLTTWVQPLLVSIDRDRMQQVITNLLTNALKYSAPDQAVIVQVERLEPEVRVSVIDRGEGIEPSEQEQIWNRFYRIEHSAAKHSSSEGLGLGLYISRQIIQLHAGQIGVHSKVGEGSTFWFTLPMP